MSQERTIYDSLEEIRQEIECLGSVEGSLDDVIKQLKSHNLIQSEILQAQSRCAILIDGVAVELRRIADALGQK